MRQHLLAFLASLLISLPMVAVAGPVVLELYTAQGCSSCPPADELLSELAPRDDVIALALHVDYWDFIGWPDSFADPAFTRRQKAYARRAGNTSLYTPQAIIDGVDRVVANRAMKLANQIDLRKAVPARVQIALTRVAGELTIRLAAVAGRPVASCDVAVVRYIPQKTVKILRGENAGKTISYANIVTSWKKVAHWNGADPTSLKVRVVGNEPVVVIVQSLGQGPILAAARLR